MNLSHSLQNMDKSTQCIPHSTVFFLCPRPAFFLQSQKDFIYPQGAIKICLSICLGMFRGFREVSDRQKKKACEEHNVEKAVWLMNFKPLTFS